MSILVKDRKTSKVQFVTTANDIFMKVSRLVANLPKRLGDSRTVYITDTSYNIIVSCVSANCIYVNDSVDYTIRNENLLKARTNCFVLMTLIDGLLRENPQRNKKITDEIGNITVVKVPYINNKHALELINMIDSEIKLINGVIRYDLDQCKKKGLI